MGEQIHSTLCGSVYENDIALDAINRKLQVFIKNFDGQRKI